MSRWYDRKGKALGDLFEWARLLEDREYCRVAQLVEQMANGERLRISTVWLGLDHNFSGQGPPLIFETMVFGGPFDEGQWRWSTEDEAQKGHDIVVQAYRENLDPHRLIEAWREDERRESML